MTPAQQMPEWPEKPHLLAGCRKWNFYWHENYVSCEARLRVAVVALESISLQSFVTNQVGVATEALRQIGEVPK